MFRNSLQLNNILIVDIFVILFYSIITLRDVHLQETLNKAWHTGHVSSLYAQCVIGVDFASFEIYYYLAVICVILHLVGE